MMIINKTPHPINFVGQDGAVTMTLPACSKEELIRLKAETVSDEPIGEVPTSRTVFGEPQGLPPFAEGIFYVVSAIVKTALPDREDLLVPAEAVRNENGHIIGCRSLGR